MQNTRIYLVRHGQVEGHEERRYNGQVNVPLTQLGGDQSVRVCDYLSEISLDAIYCSDLDRSLYCAELIAAVHDLPINTKKALREMHFGDWEGRTWTELQKAYPDDWQARLQNLVNFQVPGGESLQEAADRVRPIMQEILARHPGGRIAVVAHGGINRILLLDALGAPLEQAFSIEQDYGCLNVIDYVADGGSIVTLMNGTEHQESRGCL